MLGAWGSKKVSIAARRCEVCGFFYAEINFASDPDGRIAAIGEDGEDLAASALEAGCGTGD